MTKPEQSSFKKTRIASSMVAGGTKRYTKQLAMALSASLMAEGYEVTIHD